MASKQNFTFEEGTPFAKRLVWRNKARRPIDVTGFGMVMEIRALATDPTVLLTLSTANGRITLGGASGAINIMATEEEVAALPQFCFYKLAVTPPSGIKRYLLEGKITVVKWG